MSEVLNAEVTSNDGQPVVLDGTAAAIWALIDGRRDQADVIAELEATFEDAAGQLAPGGGFLASLEAQRLIEADRAAKQSSNRPGLEGES